MSTSPSIELHQLVLIKENVVHQLNVETVSMVSLDSFINSLSARSATATPMLPDGCVMFLSRENGSSYYWIVRPPTVWSVGFQANNDERPYNSGALFGVLVPWTLYNVAVIANIPTRVSMFMLKERPLSTEAMLYRSYLPNQNEDGYCCLHQDLLADCNNRDVPLVTRINRLIGRVAASNFNDDLSGWRTGRPASILAINAERMPEVAPHTDTGLWCRRLASWTLDQLKTGTPLTEIAQTIDLVPLGALNTVLNTHNNS